MPRQYNIIFIDLDARDVWHHKIDLEPTDYPFADTYDSYTKSGHLVGTPLSLRLLAIRHRFHSRRWTNICPRYAAGSKQYQAIYGKFVTTR